MGSAAIFKHVPYLLAIVLLLLASCSAHKSSNHKGRSRGYNRSYGGYSGYGGGYGRYGGRPGHGRGNLPGLANCYDHGAFPCHGIAYSIHCYTSAQRCNGHSNCPFGDDEMNCPSGSNPTRTVFSTRTSTRTTTSTTTTTTTTTTSTTTTVSSTVTSTSTSSRKLTALVPYQATSSAATLTTTTVKSFDALMQITPDSEFAVADIICENLMMVAAPAVIPNGPAFYHLRPVTWTLSITPTAHVSCMPSTTTYV